MSAALADLARAKGIHGGYLDQTGRRHETTPETQVALLAAMGIAAGSEAEARAALDRIEADEAARRLPRWLVVEAGTAPQLAALDGASWEIALEGGEVLTGQGADLAPLPLGIHDLIAGGETCALLSAPASLPEPGRGWGVTLPLYGLCGADRGGIGSYADLAEALGGLGRAGADFVGINPIHAGFTNDPEAFSPYSPSSRRRVSTLHIAAGAEPGAPGPLIDYGQAVAAQKAALAALWEQGPDDGFDPWLAEQGDDLIRFARHQALSDRFGPYWPDWPAAYRSPDSPEVAVFARNHPQTIRFHAWAQYLAEQQLAEVRRAGAGMAFGLYLDLAVGTHPAGAETWADPGLFAHGASLGAPPDGFSAEGQMWNLAPLRPDVLATRGFRPLAEILRGQLKFARLLRIDHILGFERAFWVPEGRVAPGAYVQMPKAALLAVARIEAARVGATIIGEDLGNIPDGLHADLDAAGLLGCRVAMFEQDWAEGAPRFKPAAQYDRRVLTSVATHDLPTWAGWRAGTDIDWRHRLGAIDAATHRAARIRRAAEVEALDAVLPSPDLDGVHRHLAATPSRLVAVQIEDILGLEDQPNLPGTIHEHPNWRRRLPLGAKSLGTHPTTLTTARIMAQNDR